jgi:hypothetical protein
MGGKEASRDGGDNAGIRPPPIRNFPLHRDYPCALLRRNCLTNMCRLVAILAFLGGSLGIGPAASAITSESENWWPGPVRLHGDPAGRPDELTALGPLWSAKEGPETRVLSFRPFWTEVTETPRDAVSFHVLYPLFNFYDYGTHHHWHVLNLIRGASRNEGEEGRLQIWPFLFWEDRPGEDRDTFALWPVGGRLLNFFGRDELVFWAWPFYVRSERPGETRYGTPWPFVQWREGEATGFALWPLGGHFERPGRYARTFALWPLFYDHREHLDRPVPTRRLGILPFYARETAEGLEAETYLWPFFGYTRERAPRPVYDETRYLWPLFVQGGGEGRLVNRWLPFYAHERRGEATKWWYLWPFLKREEIDLGFLTRHRTQVLFFLFRDEWQTDGADFHARRQHLWPLYSYWDNGAGHRQVQAFDPFTVFFPRNRVVRENWTPLFALYRSDERHHSSRRSWLWNLIVIERAPEEKRISVGPLYQYERHAERSRWSVLRGLVARSTVEGEAAWTWFWWSPGGSSS